MCFNPRAPCGARPSIRPFVRFGSVFQSTRPVRGATRRTDKRSHHRCVSIHAPRAGRDEQALSESARDLEFQSTRPVRGATILGGHFCARPPSFNPRAPCGARPVGVGSADLFEGFQSTRPVRGATRAVLHRSPRRTVSIHAPRAGRDAKRMTSVSRDTGFQSTRPVRGATSRSKMFLVRP